MRSLQRVFVVAQRRCRCVFGLVFAELGFLSPETSPTAVHVASRLSRTISFPPPKLGASAAPGDFSLRRERTASASRSTRRRRCERFPAAARGPLSAPRASPRFSASPCATASPRPRVLSSVRPGFFFDARGSSAAGLLLFPLSILGSGQHVHLPSLGASVFLWRRGSQTGNPQNPKEVLFLVLFCSSTSRRSCPGPKTCPGRIRQVEDKILYMY